MKQPVSTAVALVLVACAAVAHAADDSKKTIKDLKAPDIQVHKDAKVESSIAKAMDNYRRFLQLQKTDPELHAEAMRRLGDLSLDSGDLGAHGEGRSGSSTCKVARPSSCTRLC